MIIGVDIGGTTIKGGLVDNGKIVHNISVPTDISRQFDSLFTSICKVIDALLDYGDVQAIGISSAGDIDPIHGKVIYATSVLPDYTGKEIRKLLVDKYGIKVSVMNDAMCALIGEMTYGSVVGENNVAMLTLGTGVGGEIAVNGKVLLGDNCRGMRLGHNYYGRQDRLCPCGKIGCVETFVSATGLKETARRNGINVEDCRQLFCREVPQDTSDKIIEEFTQDLARVVDNIATTYKVDCIVIGGGLIYLQQFWWQQFLSKTNKKIKICKATLGNDAGIIGASIITQKQCF